MLLELNLAKSVVNQGFNEAYWVRAKKQVMCDKTEMDLLPRVYRENTMDTLCCQGKSHYMGIYF